MPVFSDLIDRVMEDPERTGMRPVVEKEILHYDIIFALDREGLLDDLVFQGGTCLRLCYGAPRFSEDLDFVGGTGFANAQLQEIRECVMDHIGARYGLDVSVKDPKKMREEPTYQGLLVDRWQVAVRTASDRPDMPSQKIKLEVANVPAHTSELNSLGLNYPFLPESYQDMLVPTETLDEILADKIVSLPSCRNYIRHRDIWDIRWLQQNGAEVNGELVAHKIFDYGATNFRSDVAEMIDGLPDVTASSEFRDEMGRFLPAESRGRTLKRDGFAGYLARNVAQALRAGRDAVYARDPDADFTL